MGAIHTVMTVYVYKLQYDNSYISEKYSEKEEVEN